MPWMPIIGRSAGPPLECSRHASDCLRLDPVVRRVVLESARILCGAGRPQGLILTELDFQDILAIGRDWKDKELTGNAARAHR